MSSLKFGTIYFHHSVETEYVGPRLTREVGGSFIQIDTADASMWLQTEKNKGKYDWSLFDTAYNECEKWGIEPVPSFAHHFIPPKWIKNGPINIEKVKAPEYAKFGNEYAELTFVQKSFADFVNAFLNRYGDKTNFYILSHEWQYQYMKLSEPNSLESSRIIKNQLISMLLAYKIIKEFNSLANITYGLLNLYRRNSEEGKVTSPWTFFIKENVFGPPYMFNKYLETGDPDFLGLLKTFFIFHCGYTTALEGFTSIYNDTSVGEALNELYNGQTSVNGKIFRNKDYMKEIMVSAAVTEMPYYANTQKIVNENECAETLRESIHHIIQKKETGIPVTRIIASLNDKYEDWSNPFTGKAQFHFVSEGLYKMYGVNNYMEPPPIGWKEYVPKPRARIFKEAVSKYSEI